MYIDVKLKGKWKTGQFRAKSIPGQILSRKFFLPKNFLSCVDFKNRVFKKPDFGQKTGPGRLGDIIDMWDHHKASF